MGGTPCWQRLHRPSVSLVLVRRLVDQKVCSQLLVLVARKVCLNHEVPLEAKAAKLKLAVSANSCATDWKLRKASSSPYPLDRLPLLLCHAHRLRPWRQRGVLVCVLAQQLQELLRVGPDELRQLRVAHGHLL